MDSLILSALLQKTIKQLKANKHLIGKKVVLEEKPNELYTSYVLSVPIEQDLKKYQELLTELEDFGRSIDSNWDVMIGNIPYNK